MKKIFFKLFNYLNEYIPYIFMGICIGLIANKLIKYFL
jgi:hypothetical protein